jgi:3-oxoacyl-[acyl-carrier protein] reductase
VPESFLEERAGLRGKSALVAGGGGGLGQAVALDFARAGMDLAICDRDAESLGVTTDEARNLGATVLEGVLDVREPGALESFFDRLDVGLTGIDVLVNVVGGTFRSPFVDVSSKGIEVLIRTNFTWITQAIQLAARRMIAQGRGGSIITITSIEAHRAAPGYAIYSSMKAAVTQLSRILAVELGPDRIRVNTIAPDIVPTVGMGRFLRAGEHEGRGLTDAMADKIDEMQIPLARKGVIADVGNCALFLASDMSSYITGTSLHPDGGALASSGWLNWPEVGWTARPPHSVL